MSDYSFVKVAKARERMCKQFHSCTECPLPVMGRTNCAISILKEPEQSQEIIMKWEKEHPVKTNADKFKEVFGFGVDYIDGCMMDIENKRCTDPYGGCADCENSMSKFWQQEYKE